MKAEFLLHIHKIQLKVPILSHLNPLHVPVLYFSNVTVRHSLCLFKRYNTKTWWGVQVRGAGFGNV